LAIFLAQFIYSWSSLQFLFNELSTVLYLGIRLSPLTPLDKEASSGCLSTK
jgi:hypothetical protein